MFTMVQKKISETNKVTITYDEEKGNKIVNSYYFVETIGKGAYSKVKRAIHLETKKEYAIKILNKRLLRKKKKSYGKTSDGWMKINYMIQDALNEIEIYKQFPQTHQNVLKLYEIINDDTNDKTYLVMELADYGSIVSINEKTGVFTLNSHYDNEKYDEKLIKRFILDIAKGLSFCKFFV